MKSITLRLLDFSQDCKKAVFKEVMGKDRILIKVDSIPESVLPLLPIGRLFNVKTDGKTYSNWKKVI